MIRLTWVERKQVKESSQRMLREHMQNELRRVEGVLLAQKAIGGHHFASETKLTDTELKELIPKQVAWLRAKVVRLAALEHVLTCHPRIGHLVELWVEDLQRSPIDKSKKK